MDISNCCEENCEEDIVEAMAESSNVMPDEDPLTNMIEEFGYMHFISPNEDVRESFLFLQDKYMRRFFDKFPEIICIDILCKLTKLHLNVYVFIAIDTNGACEIIALAFLKSCDKGIEWLCDTFTKCNQNAVDKIKIIYSHKILQSNALFRNAFSEKPVLTTFFHFIQYLKQELFYIGFDANDEIIKKVVMIYHDMCTNILISEWPNLLEELKSCHRLFSNNYRILNEIQEQFISNKKFNFKLLWRQLNIFLYSIRKSLKPNICSLDTIEEVLQFCFSFIQSSRIDKFKCLEPTFIEPVANESLRDYFECSKILTPFATKLIFEQLDDSKYMLKTSPNDVVHLSFTTDKFSCTCSFYISFALPCSHVFAVRRRNFLFMFHGASCSRRWHKTYYKEVLNELYSVLFEQHIQKLTKDKSAEMCKTSRFFRQHGLEQLMARCDNRLRVDVWKPPDRGRSSEGSHLVNVVKSLRATKGSLMDLSFEELYGISLDDILSCDVDFI